LGRVGINASSPGAALTIGDEGDLWLDSFDTTVEEKNASSGRVGIGTTSPGYLLDVDGGGTIPAQFGTTVNWNYAGLLLRRNASNVSTAKMLSMLLQGDTDSDTTLTNHLNIWGTYSGTPATGSTTAGLSGVLNLGAPNALAFHTNTSERLRIDSSGRLLVGLSTASGSSLLQVNGEASAHSLKIRSPDGSWWDVGVSNSGTLTVTRAALLKR
jgi:hypothetical protein